MKINELNEVGAPHLPALRGAHLPAVVKPIPLGTEFRAPDPRTGAKPNATAKPAPDVTDVPYKDTKTKAAEPMASDKKGMSNTQKAAAVAVPLAVVGTGAYMAGAGRGKVNPPAVTPNTQPATVTNPPGPVNPPPKPQPNLGYKGSEGSQSLMALNPDKIKNVNQIKAGDSIDLGGGNMYKIQKGDTLDKIAQRMTRPSGQPRAELDKPDSVLPGPSAEKPPAPAPVTPVTPAKPPETSMDDSNDANASTFTNPNTSMDDSNDANASAFVNPAVSQTNNDILNALRNKPPTQAATTTAPSLPTTDRAQSDANKAAEKASMDPEAQKKLGNADPTDYFIRQGIDSKVPTNPASLAPGADVKSGDGSSWKSRDGSTVKTSSDAELQWRQANPRQSLPSQEKIAADNARDIQNREAGKKFWGNVGDNIKGIFTKESFEELNRIRKLSGMPELMEAGMPAYMKKPAPTPATAPTTATNASSLRTMQNQAGTQTGTTGPAAPVGQPAGSGSAKVTPQVAPAQSAMNQVKPPAVTPAVTSAGASGPPGSFQRGAGIQAATVGGGRGGQGGPTAAQTQAATTAGSKMVKPATPAGPPVGSQAQTAGGANELAKTGIMGGQPAPTAAPANPGTANASVAFNQGNLGTRAPAETPSAFNQGALGTRAPATQPTSGSPMAGVNYKKDVAFGQGNTSQSTQAATTSTAGSGVANNTTMTPQQAPAQSAMNQASNKQAATTSDNTDADERDFEESIMRESTMELNQLRKFSGLPELTESEVTVHKGTYGNSYGKEDVRDQYGHKIGKIDKGSEAKKDAPKRGRGRPTKGDKDEHGNDTKFDTSGLQGMLGSKAKGEVGKKSVKHSLKDWMEVVSDNMINESEDTTMEDTHVMRAKDGNSASWYGKNHMGGGGQYQQHRDDTAKALKGLRASGQKLAVGDTAKVGDQELTRFGRGKDSAENRAFDPQIEEDNKKQMSRAAKGHEKYGKKGMQALADAGREGKNLEPVRAKYNKYDEGSMQEAEYKGVRPVSNAFTQTAPYPSFKKKKPASKEVAKDTKPAENDGRLKGVDEAKDLPGKQDNLDVAEPKGKLTKADFEALRKKKKVSEARVMEESEYTYEKVGKTLAQENPTLASDSDEFANAVYHEMIQMGMTPKSAHYKLNHDPDFLGEVVTAFHHYLGQGTVDEGAGAGRGSVNPPVVNPNTPAPAARTASPGWGKDDYKPLVPDNSKTFKPAVSDPEGVKEAGSFIRNLASTRRAFEGKDMKDVQLESWSKELDSLLNENITISTTIDDQGHDSVNVSATEGNAHEIIELLRNAGLGGMGGGKQEHGQKVNNYGLPMSGSEHHGPEAQLIAVGSPQAHSEIGDEGGDDMMQLIQKMTDIEGSGEQDSQNYEHEEGHEEEHDHEDGECEECGESPCACDDEQEVDEGKVVSHNKGSGYTPHQKALISTGAGLVALNGIGSAVNQAADMAGYGDKKKNSTPTPTPTAPPPTTSDAGAGQSSSEFSKRDPRRLDTGGDDVDEGNDFTEKLKNTQHGEKFSIGGKEYTDTSSIEEGHDSCNECGYPMESCGCDYEEVNESAASQYDSETQERIKAATPKQLSQMAYEFGGDPSHYEHELKMLQQAKAELSRQLEEYANDADDTADQDLEFMMRTLSGGGGMGEKRSQATAPIIKIVTAEGTLMRDSTDLLSDFRKLSGI